MEKTWLNEYPKGVPASVNVSAYGSLNELIETAFRKHADKTAYTFLGKSLSFAEVDRLSRMLGGYLQSLGLQRGDRVASHATQRAAISGGDRGHPARRLHPGQRQSALHAARTRTPAQGLRRQGHRRAGELCQHSAGSRGSGADAARDRRLDGRPHRIQGTDRQLRRAQGQEAGAGVPTAPVRSASSRL
jgi:non-ribosomal peptide synthetase component F